MNVALLCRAGSYSTVCGVAGKFERELQKMLDSTRSSGILDDVEAAANTDSFESFRVSDNDGISTFNSDSQSSNLLFRGQVAEVKDKLANRHPLGRVIEHGARVGDANAPHSSWVIGRRNEAAGPGITFVAHTLHERPGPEVFET